MNRILKKIIILFTIILMTTACKASDKNDNSITFKTGETYTFEEMAIQKIENEDEMKTVEIFNGKDNEEKKKEIIELLSNLEISGDENSYSALPDKNSLIIDFKNKDNYETLIMYDIKKDENTNKYHYTFFAKIGDKDAHALLSEEDLMTKILEIVEK